MSFKTAIDDMMAASTDDKVGLVLRWDQNDDFMWTYFSSPRAAAMAPNLTPVGMNGFVRKRRDYTKTGGHNDVMLGTTASEGFHAEELMLLSWEGLLTSARAHNASYYPKTVEMVLSKSPCNGNSGSAPLDVMYTHGTFSFDVVGCAAKLAKFIRTQPVNKWIIRYYHLAGAKSNSTDADRLAAGQAYVPQAERAKAQHATTIDDWENNVPQKMLNAPPAKQKEAVGRAADLKLDKFLKSSDMVALENAMRCQSLQPSRGLGTLPVRR